MLWLCEQDPLLFALVQRCPVVLMWGGAVGSLEMRLALQVVAYSCKSKARMKRSNISAASVADSLTVRAGALV